MPAMVHLTVADSVDSYQMDGSKSDSPLFAENKLIYGLSDRTRVNLPNQ